MHEGMRLTVLGSGSCELRKARSSPSYLLQAGSSNLLLDLGQGAWRKALEQSVTPVSVEVIILSHHHLDHISDLFPLLFALNYDPVMHDQARIALVAHGGFRMVMEGLAGVFGDWVRPPERNLNYIWLQPGEDVRLGEVDIGAVKAKHMETSLAYRLEHDGRCLVYLGDSEYDPALASFAAGADLLIAHCAATDANPKPGHMGPSQAGRLAEEAGVRSLLLSHFYREVDPLKAVSAAGKQFRGRVFAAEDGLKLDLEAEIGAKLHKP